MSADERTPVLAAEDIVAGYITGVDVLRGCSVRVEPGELVGVIGPNGAGKSTLIKAVFGLLRVRDGTVRLLDEDVTNRPAHEQVRRGVGYVPQLQNVFPALTVEENLRMGIYLRPRAFARRVAEVQELFPVLAARRKQKAGSMSGGERQMLAMARALMMEPRLLLLDEPSAGLSPAHQDLVFERVKEINGAGVAVLMVEQNARRCLQICDRGYVLDQGRNAYTGTGSHLLHDEKVIELYLGTLARVR
ncbi:ABC transporter ATP-binding protein [Streptomyces sp. HUAS ZL42]|uniref:ABC transporter ATP-binding protein n=1 Tax=Streptomyces sp. HUAS ZL42 TaxID=3231715 RepID=UPI00345E3B0A